MRAGAVLLALFVVAPEPTTTFDRLERNTTLAGEYSAGFEQWIGWDWDHSDGCWRCQWWTQASTVRHETIGRDGVRIRMGTRTIEARQYSRSVTQSDPELSDRTHWPVERRRGLRR